MTQSDDRRYMEILGYQSDMLCFEICIGNGALLTCFILKLWSTFCWIKLPRKASSIGHFPMENTRKSFAEPSRTKVDISDYPCIIKGSAEDLEELSASLA